MRFHICHGETEAGEASAAVTVVNKTTNGQVSITGIPTGGSNVTARKIYRTAAAGATYLLLATLADNTTTTYTDNTADASLGSAAPSTNTTVDPYLATLITVARMTCENFTKRKLITQTWRQYHDTFPACREIDIFLPPLQSVTSVQYKDTAGATQTLDTDYYTVSATGERGRICLNDGYSWPDTLAGAPDAMWITMVAGYGSARSDVPAPLRQGMLTLIGHYYNMREDVIAGTIVSAVPKTSDYLWSPYKSYEF